MTQKNGNRELGMDMDIDIAAFLWSVVYGLELELEPFQKKNGGEGDLLTYRYVFNGHGAAKTRASTHPPTHPTKTFSHGHGRAAAGSSFTYLLSTTTRDFGV